MVVQLFNHCTSSEIPTMSRSTRYAPSTRFRSLTLIGALLAALSASFAIRRWLRA